MENIPYYDKPKHQHDCENCIYLGTYVNVSGNDQIIDCYWCSKESCPPLSSVLGRFGSDGPDYYSGHPFDAFAEKEKFLTHASAWWLFAMIQAVRKGLYKFPE